MDLCHPTAGSVQARWRGCLLISPACSRWCCIRTCPSSAKPSGINSTALSLSSVQCCEAVATLCVPWVPATAWARWAWPQTPPACGSRVTQYKCNTIQSCKHTFKNYSLKTPLSPTVPSGWTVSMFACVQEAIYCLVSQAQFNKSSAQPH